MSYAIGKLLSGLLSEKNVGMKVFIGLLLVVIVVVIIYFTNREEYISFGDAPRFARYQPCQFNSLGATPYWNPLFVDYKDLYVKKVTNGVPEECDPSLFKGNYGYIPLLSKNAIHEKPLVEIGVACSIDNPTECHSIFRGESANRDTFYRECALKSTKDMPGCRGIDACGKCGNVGFIQGGCGEVFGPMPTNYFYMVKIKGTTINITCPFHNEMQNIIGSRYRIRLSPEYR